MPLTKLLSSEARNVTALAISSGVPARPDGMGVYLKVDETLDWFLGKSETVVARCRDHSGTNHVDPNISSLEVQDSTPSEVANRCLTCTVDAKRRSSLDGGG